MIAPTLLRLAMADVTPPENLPLGGYTERGSQSGHAGSERLHARVLLFENEGRKVAVVSFEALTIPESLVRETRKRLPGIELMLVGTHTHNAPDSQMLNDRMTLGIPGIANYRQKWLRWTADQLAGAVRQAQDAPARTVESVEVARRTVEDGNRNRRGGTPPDSRASTLLINGQPVAFTFAAHPTLLGAKDLQYSGDWPGVAARSLGAFLPGAIGDASPVSPRSGSAGVDELGARIIQVWDTPGPVGWMGSEFTDFLRAPVRLEPPVPHPKFAQDYKVNDTIAKLMVDKFAPTSAELSILTLGRLAIVGVPGEPTGDVGRRIEAEGAKSGFWATWVVSHCNGWIGYILEPADYDKGGYEANLAMHGRNTADRVVEAAGLGLARAAAHRNAE